LGIFHPLVRLLDPFLIFTCAYFIVRLADLNEIWRSEKFEAKVKFKIEIMVTGSISIRWLFQHLADVTWSKLTLIYRNSNTKAKNNPRFFIIFPSFFAYPPAFSCSI